MYNTGMTYQTATVDEYCAAIPEERREPFGRLRRAILENLPEGFEETISYKLPSYVVPHSIYPPGYHCRPEEPVPYLSIASQKNFISYYHGGIYSMPDLAAWFRGEWERLKLGKLDMGKSCIRLKNIGEIPYELLGELAAKITVDEWIAFYEQSVKR